MMIARYENCDGTVQIEIHCGCCGLFFLSSVGGTCFCKNCIKGIHAGCKVKEIMGIKG